ncbi:spore germination protein [Bacillus taeanensis]|uniref:Spore germination protein n=1 Tax=Bacillus taeanensis TaxID=273032 RepID=A0A366Y2V8_9BACI|nr:spore germination protein [Bacillus taeanensis]RBW71339.1 spore germination protein [Bacillus taeanensis]
MKKKLFSRSAEREKETIPNFIAELKKSADFLCYLNHTSLNPYMICYYRPLIDGEIVHRDVLPHFNRDLLKTIKELKSKLSIENVKISQDPNEMREKLLQGYILLQLISDEENYLLVPAPLHKERQVSLPEVEFSVVGPKEAFVESLDANLNLIRKRLPTPQLKVKEIEIGSLSSTKVAILYMEEITNDQYVETLSQRLESVEFDQVIDSSYLTQMIEDNSRSLFPQLIDTERPDRVAASLAEGKVTFLVDGSPHAVTGPTTLVEFFSAFEDYFLSWHIASFFRLVRIFAVSFSIFATPVYVAVITYHYELIPKDLLGTLVSSRSQIPFPPVLEAIFLEITIELLREAGARLPTKVGQTIGIVGGIVIGTASVEAGLTSNVLLIIVALSALGSFTTPVYRMGNTIRILRFPFIIFAQFWGLLGIMICTCFVLTHLLRLTSLGSPYMAPIYPPRIPDLKDALFRLPFSRQSLRPMQLRTKNPVRFNVKRDKQNKDIDE